MRRFALVLAAVFLAACATQSAQSLDRSSWMLEGGPITIAFADGRVTGSGGCNQYFAAYQTSGSTLSLGPIGSTKRACADEARNRAEVAYLEALGKVASYAIEGNVLTLRDASGATLLEFLPSR